MIVAPSEEFVTMGRPMLSPLLTETSLPHAPAEGSGEMTDQALAEKLRAQGVALTLQRLVIARVLLTRPIHLSADQVWARAKAVMPEISRATVYNTLDLFERSGLLRRLIIDAEKVVFDSNTASHHHLYDATTGEVIDIAPGELQVIGVPHLPPGVELEDVDVVVRVRRRGG